ncbi:MULTISPECIES: polyprenol monophosphomannose synthase [Glycomyces]|uniref:Dolichol-phosphate mannosyltransferase n=2 Tax=Glycomyces TaxID=58113 RepID=A0A9X3PPL0_9ACTN|nr:polyprenol monophosphomannose synthase [Glycomyces lechevalierae]MDA1386887.1 polyprenol monophosphomannose synthase [Glycomyces lechevalierae]MDR7336312.1 dolichol-phosphate mannosyltransferase [Glycomyces lechevalierae]
MSQTPDRGPAGNDTSPAIVAIPTYNERDNIETTVAAALAGCDRIDILIVDDSSPDGTGEIADALAAAEPRVHVLHRAEKQGLGAAYLAAFDWATRHGYRTVVEMDADGSHDPADLPRLLAALDDGADVAIGSRYIPGGAVRNWALHRLALSRGAGVFTRAMLGLRVKDVTAGYRAYRLDGLHKLQLDTVNSVGYCFQIDLTWRAVKAGFDIREVPIVFTERRAGASKMSGAITVEALWNVSRWGLAHRARQLKSALRRGRIEG